MANKRNLKKQVRYICGDIAAECAFALEAIPGIDRDAMGKCLTDVAALQEGTLAKVTFDFDKTPGDFDNPAAYRRARQTYNNKAFTKLRIDFNERVEEIVSRMNAALPKATCKPEA